MNKGISCLFIRGRLEQFVDEELSEARQDSVRDHLARCAACREEVKLLFDVRRAVQGITVPSYDERFWDELWREIEVRADKTRVREIKLPSLPMHRSYRRLSLAAAVAGMLFLLVLGGILLFTPSREPVRSVVPYIDYHVSDMDQHVLLQNHFWSNEYLPVSYNGE